MTLFDLIGIAGVGVILIAYFQLQRGRFSSHSTAYLGLNILGSCLILVSLIGAWNLASACMQMAWIGISVYGMMKGKS